MLKVCVLTGTRAEYGLLYHTIKAIDQSPLLQLQLIVTGSHLSPGRGHTVDAIIKDKIKIDYKIDMLIESAQKSAIPKSMGLLMIQLAAAFDDLRPDIVLILGDRYETLVFASCATALNVPIAHMHGGEASEGAIDEQIRHAITKMAHIHFTSTDIYMKNVLRMGEQPFRVYNVGAPVVENIRKHNFLPRGRLEEKLGLSLAGPVFVVTYHPVTLNDRDTDGQAANLLNALGKFGGTFIFTGANADHGGSGINELIKTYIKNKDNCYFFDSLGYLYMDVCKHADIMVGNSSSGIIEAPCFKLPVVNIGERQKGRLRHPNIIDAGYGEADIIQGINKALYDECFKSGLTRMELLYGNGTTSSQIIKVLEGLVIDDKFMLKSLDFSDNPEEAPRP